MKTKIISVILVFLIVCNAYSSNVTNWEYKTLDTRQITNITALSHSYGYVRYFYPNRNLEDFDWMKFLMYAAGKVDAVQTDEELKETLTELFRPLCPDIAFTDDALEITSKLKPPYYAVSHKGIGLYVDIFQGKKYTPITLFTEDLGYDSLYSYKISDSLFIRFPIAVHSLPPKTKELNNLSELISRIDKTGINTMTFLFNRKKIRTEKFLFHNLNYRFADLIVRYNFIQHFYAYYDEDGLVDIWDKHFKKTLNIIAQTNSLNDYYYNLSRYTSVLKDQHLTIWQSVDVGLSLINMYLSMSYPNIEYGFVKDTCYVKSVGDSYKNQISKGDIIVAVNNQNIQTLIAEKMSMSANSTREAGLQRMSREGRLFETQSRDSIIKVTLTDKSNQIYEAELKTALNEAPFASNPYFIKKYDEELYYINLCSRKCTYKRFKKLIPDLLSAKGIIFDLRGYPQSDVIPIISHFIEEKIEIGQLFTPIYRFPNHKNVKYEDVEKWGVEPAISSNSKSLSKKYEYKTPIPVKIEIPIVFLINAETMSFGETIVEMIKNYNIAPLIGTPTAGCNGDITQIHIPNFNFYLTYNKFFNRDGSQHHAIGVLPDIYCESTIPDIQNDVDTQLEMAKRVLSENEK